MGRHRQIGQMGHRAEIRFLGSAAVTMKKANSVADYIKNARPEAQARLREMRRLVRSAAPGATEAIKWGMPSVTHRKKIVACYAAFKKHIGLFPGSAAVAAFSKDLGGFKHAKGS